MHERASELEAVDARAPKGHPAAAATRVRRVAAAARGRSRTSGSRVEGLDTERAGDGAAIRAAVQEPTVDALDMKGVVARQEAQVLAVVVVFVADGAEGLVRRGLEGGDELAALDEARELDAAAAQAVAQLAHGQGGAALAALPRLERQAVDESAQGVVVDGRLA